jgi:hypothetical protein
MKTVVLKISFIFLLWYFMGAGCEKVSTQPLEDRNMNIVSTNFIGCKEESNSTLVEQYIKLEAVGKNQLRIKFINAHLNCCPGEIYSSAYITNETLKINFREATPAKCNCMCYYDVECIIDSLERREYSVEIYAHSEKPNAKFSFNFSETLNKTIAISND